MDHQGHDVEELKNPAVENGTAESSGKDQLELTTERERKRVMVHQGLEMKKLKKIAVENGTAGLSGEDSLKRATNHQGHEMEKLKKPAVENGAAGSSGGDRLEREREGRTNHEGLEIEERKNAAVDADAGSYSEAVICCLARVRRRLGETERERDNQDQASSCTVFRIPPTLRGTNAVEPEIVSIGPYHRGRAHLLEFEEHKWFFLKSFLHRTTSDEESLLAFVAEVEGFARRCYSELGTMLDSDFVEMMLLDSCFLLEFLIRIFKSDDKIGKNDPIFTKPWIIPILIRDLLKLENQVPYFLLERVFSFSGLVKVAGLEEETLGTLVLKMFHMAYPIPPELFKTYGYLPCDHVLHLFYLTLFPSSGVHSICSQRSRPSNQSIPCATQLSSSGIKFKSTKTQKFLDISFKKQVLEIPSITMDDFTTTMLINCLALEQCQENSSKYITDYVSFIHCIISQPKDVSLLRSEGIITRFSNDDQYVVNLFNELGKSIVFNVHDCYLSKQFEGLESYYNSYWAYIMRTYFSNPWSFIAIFFAFLGIALAMIQTVYAVLGHRYR